MTANCRPCLVQRFGPRIGIAVPDGLDDRLGRHARPEQREALRPVAHVDDRLRRDHADAGLRPEHAVADGEHARLHRAANLTGGRVVAEDRERRHRIRQRLLRPRAPRLPTQTTATRTNTTFVRIFIPASRTSDDRSLQVAPNRPQSGHRHNRRRVRSERVCAKRHQHTARRGRQLQLARVHPPSGPTNSVGRRSRRHLTQGHAFPLHPRQVRSASMRATPIGVAQRVRDRHRLVHWRHDRAPALLGGGDRDPLPPCDRDRRAR